MNIPETFIHYVWEKGLAGQHFILDTGDDCRIVKPGKRGIRDGPDFENTEIMIGSRLLAGNSEIHIRSSDWFRHGHHEDPVYDKTILHIVLNNDAIICNHEGFIIPTLILPVDEITRLYSSYSESSKYSMDKLHCSEFISDIDPEAIMPLIESLSLQRIKRKAKKTSSLLAQNEHDWLETTWKLLAWAYGLTQNTAPMEWLSNTLTWKNLVKAGNVFSAEALLLGQGGFLNQEIPLENGYICALQQEYKHWKNKFSLTPIDVLSWKYNPVRPSSMPEIRLAQLAALVSKVPDVFNAVVSARNMKDFYRIFRQPVSGFWKTHCRPGTVRKGHSPGTMGKGSVDIVAINVLIPLLIAYSEYTGRQEYLDSALNLMKNIRPEQNKIIDIFVRNAGIKVSNAFETQGLLELYDTLCSSNNCMACPVMNQLIRTTSHE